MDKLLRISRWIDACNERIGKLTSWLVLVMIIIGVWNVIGRYLGRIIGRELSSNAYLEAQWYMFDLVFFLGAAYILKHDEHVRVDIFYSQCSPKRKALINLLGTVLFLIPFCVLVIIFSWDTVIYSWIDLEVSPDPGGLPRYPIKTLIPIAFILLIFQGISETIKNFAILTNRLEPQEAQNNGEL
ncbi:MAG: TRAP transporter small permease subunit [Calothrix sp. MO_167.B12]|nr:TRAP transporter small permease subunit [Calothrix sp. MO_167.B12]